MLRLRTLIVLALLAVPVAAIGDDQPLKGRLPRLWSKLGLSDSQKQQVYKIGAKADQEVAKLRAQIAAIRAKERTDQQAVLTPAQRDRLRELIAAQGPGAGAAPSENKAPGKTPKEK